MSAASGRGLPRPFGRGPSASRTARASRVQLLPLLLGTACVETDPAPQPFVDRTEAAGLAGVVHFAGFTDHRYLVETMGGGVGLFDYDSDGWLDAYLVQCAPLPEGETPPEPPANRLLKGGPSGRFEDRSRETGTDDEGFGMGCAVGDVNGDARPDLYVLNVGPNRLYVNDSGSRFDERAEEAGVTDERWSVSAGFFDPDGDGDLDLYVVNYLVFSREGQRRLFAQQGGRAVSYPHPDLFDAAADGFYRNDGSGRFADATAESGMGAVVPGKGLGVAFGDVDRDGDTDVYVANDSTPNFLFVNDGTGRFEESGATSGCAYNEYGQTEASMGVDCGDADGDGFPELFATHLDLETNTYYANLGRSGVPEFEDRTRAAGLAAPSVDRTGFGTAFFDYDSDGDADVVVVNGHIIDNVALIYPGRSYPQQDQLFENRGNGVFDDVSSLAGGHFARKRVGRGLALGDVDNDGDTDLLIGNCGEAPVLLENRATGANHWVRFRLRGGEGEPPDPQGARIEITAGGRTRAEELWRAFGYASASESAVHFGLGDATLVDRVDVSWPSGVTESWTDLAANRRYLLVRGDPRAREL